MLKRLGWSPGTGIGKNGNGITQPLKPRGQKGREGLGKKVDYSFGGNQQLDDYAQLLKSLNASYKGLERSSSTSLEELSKRNRSRLHYAKFTRAKDVSKYDEKALAIILGEKRFSEVSTNDTSVKHIPKVDGNHAISFGVKTISSSLSLTDYFNERMSVLKRKSKRTGDLATDSSNSLVESVVMKTGESDQTYVDTRKTNGVDSSNDGITRRNKRDAKCTESLNDHKPQLQETFVTHGNISLEPYASITMFVDDTSAILNENARTKGISSSVFCTTNLPLLSGYMYY
ncbi:hypothetical protein EG68_07140 [Paragonimus skrjabini miyazakii]|uniref:G-patch domain-containing protein n=1 Tax=Paragonimus skrjabini miyazakii TaxID=59628 RepID=A0A8S9YRC5_9TREM|nr:hypothetical protein EG68_07140 [Paragonimus skrjabini miyazakii]